MQFSYFTKHIFQKLILRRDIFLSVAPYQPQIALLARNILKCTSPGGLQPKIVNNLFGFWSQNPRTLPSVQLPPRLHSFSGKSTSHGTIQFHRQHLWPHFGTCSGFALPGVLPNGFIMHYMLRFCRLKCTLNIFSIHLGNNNKRQRTGKPTLFAGFFGG